MSSADQERAREIWSALGAIQFRSDLHPSRYTDVAVSMIASALAEERGRCAAIANGKSEGYAMEARGTNDVELSAYFRGKSEGLEIYAATILGDASNNVLCQANSELAAVSVSPSALQAGVEDVAMRNQIICTELQSWLDWHERQRSQEGRSEEGRAVTDDMHIYGPPKWPTRGMLKAWIAHLSAEDFEPTEAARSENATLRQRIAELEERLELTHHYELIDGEAQLVETPPERRSPSVDAVACRDSTIDLLNEFNRRQSRRIAELEGALKDAREDIEDWAGYASEYFQDKHDLKGVLAKYDAILQSKNQKSQIEEAKLSLADTASQSNEEPA